MNLPRPLRRQISRLLAERYQDALGPGETFAVDGELEEAWVQVRLELKTPGDQQRVWLEVRVAFPDEAPDQDSAMNLALDAADAVMGEFFEEGRFYRFPGDFTELEFRDTPVHLRGGHERPAVERAADALLEGEDGSLDPADPTVQ